MRVLVTGAGGFIGRALLPELLAAGHDVCASTRGAPAEDVAAAPALTPEQTDAELLALCQGCDAVVHLAAYAHEQGRRSDELLRYNAELPARLYRAALAAGAQRFVFVSSAKVLGNTASEPLAPTAPRAPAEPYAVSKAAAEQALEAAAQAPLALSIVRPPLVYGPGVGANFARLLSWATSRWPLPFGLANAPRSFLGRSNLVRGLVSTLAAPAGVYHLADAEAWNLADLLRSLYAVQGRSPALWPVPLPVLETSLRWLGQGAQAERLLAPLALDCASSCAQLGWTPEPAQVELEDTVQWFLSQR